MAMNSTVTNQNAHPFDDRIIERWGYLVRLLCLLWRLSPGAMVVIAIVNMTTGLLPLLSLAVLRRLVDVVTIGGNEVAAFRQALFWVAALAVTSALPQTARTLGGVVKSRFRSGSRHSFRSALLPKLKHCR